MTLYLLLLIAFTASHIGLASAAVRGPLVAQLGERGFQGFYSLISVLLLGGAIWAGRGVEPQYLWAAPFWVWRLGSFLMLIAAILLVGAFSPANRALPGVPQVDRPPTGVLRITRHPMMWAFAIWAVVHIAISGEMKAILLAVAIGVLALAGAAHQDSKKRRLIGESWRHYQAQTSYFPLGAQMRGRQPWVALWPGLVPIFGGLFLWLLATWLHPMAGAPTVPPWSLMIPGV